jgi:hypothetical protein
MPFLPLNFIKFVKVFISDLKFACINNNDKILEC